MIIIYSILLCQLVCYTFHKVSCFHHHTESPQVLMGSYTYLAGQTLNPFSPPLHHVKLGIVENKRIIKRVNLKPTRRALANEHLPVWILTGKIDVKSVSNTGGDELKRDYEVMKQLGEFTIYQDPGTCSSAVYFHKHREFVITLVINNFEFHEGNEVFEDGLIGDEYLIRKLSIDEIHPTEATLLPLNKVGVCRRTKYRDHTNEVRMVDTDPEAGVNNQKGAFTYEGRLYNGYPEVLVIISWDLAEEWTQNVLESDWYTTIVSNVLTLFNGVDMLYAKLDYTRVLINIAGVIIGTAKESFDFLKDCYHIRMTVVLQNFVTLLDASCVYDGIETFLDARKNEIPRESYDITVFLTRKQLCTFEEDVPGSGHQTIDYVIGIAYFPDGFYQKRKDGDPLILITPITTDKYLSNYPTLAHEIAHSMTVEHDESEYLTPNGKCSGNIMKTITRIWCDECLSWSDTSETTFYLFFRSPNCCTFINFPRSLNPPQRQDVLTADEQCNCYGYQSAISDDMREDFCETALQCGDTSREFESTVIPMDGTPCDNEKVCWGQKCKPVGIFK